MQVGQEQLAKRQATSAEDLTRAYARLVEKAAIRNALSVTDLERLEEWCKRRELLLEYRKQQQALLTFVDQSRFVVKYERNVFTDRLLQIAVDWLKPNPELDALVGVCCGKPPRYAVGGGKPRKGKRLEALHAAAVEDLFHDREVQFERLDEWCERQRILLSVWTATRSESVEVGVPGGTVNLSAERFDAQLLTCIEAEAGHSWLDALLNSSCEVFVGLFIFMLQGAFLERHKGPNRFDDSQDQVVANLMSASGPVPLKEEALRSGIACGIEVVDQGLGVHAAATAAMTRIATLTPVLGRMKETRIAQIYRRIRRELGDSDGAENGDISLYEKIGFYAWKKNW